MDLSVQNLLVKLSGAQDTKLMGNIVNQKLILNGAIDYDAQGLNSSICIIDANGAIDSKLNCSKEIRGSIRGATTLKYLGSPDLQVRKFDASVIKAMKPLSKL